MKIDIPFSFGILDFITEAEHTVLLDWANKSFRFLKRNNTSPGRFYREIEELQNIPKEVYSIEDRVKGLIDRPFVLSEQKHFLNYNVFGAAIHPHTDSNLPGYTHTRFNIFISAPDSGGCPIYNGVEFKVYDKMLWQCEAGKYTHASTPVNSQKPRICISYGYQVKNP